MLRTPAYLALVVAATLAALLALRFGLQTRPLRRFGADEPG
jgi:hypothetical protein